MLSSGASVVLAAMIVLLAVGCGRQDVFAVPENKLPVKDKYALNRYDYAELGSLQATLRADVLNVTDRNLPRGEVEMLGDDFSLIYDANQKELRTEYGIAAPGAGLNISTIHFTEYPSPSHGISATMFESQATAAGVSASDYFAYYKYMLMTQGQHLAHEARRRSAASYRAEGDTTPRTAAESLSGWLKKHPAADAQYGAVLGENNVVRKTIKLDPIYRGQHTSGLYLPAGEVATVKVSGLKPGEQISILLGEQNTLAWRGGVPGGGDAEITELTGGINSVTFADTTSDLFFKKADILTAAGSFYDYNGGESTPFLQSQWKRQNARAPWLSAGFVLNKNGEYEIGFAFGGLINISPGNCYSSAELTITGAVETPHYVLGVTTPEYFDEYLRDAPGVIGVMDTENGQLIGPTGVQGTSLYMRQIKKDEVDKLAMLWHSFFSVDESFTGGVYNRYNKVMFDWHVPAGAAVALGGYTYACPTGWFNGAMNYRGLLASGTWGILHEVGHNHGSAYGSIWGFGAGREGEVRNNALNLLAYIISCDVGTTIRNGGGAEHGGYANPYSVLNETLLFRDRGGDYDDGQYGYFQCLGMYANIMHSFGADKYYELLYTYGENPSFVARRDGDDKNIYKRADFAYRCSLIYGMNFLNYFNRYYAANIPEDYFTEEQFAFMSKLPNYEPIANFYAGEIDGVKTAGDYKVTFGADITFDLLGKTICTLDEGETKGFKILSVGAPERGSIRDLGEGKYAYSFDKNYTGALDKFSFCVRLNDGVIHELTITLRINYNGASVQSFGDIKITAKNAEGKLEEALAQTSEMTPEILNGSAAYYYTSPAGKNEVKIVEYYFKAPESGNFELSLRGDDYAYAYFGESFDTLEQIMILPKDSAGYSENLKYSVKLVKDKLYAVRLFNLNTGGRGGVALGIRAEGETSFADISKDFVYHPNARTDQKFEEYVFEPKYLISKKDNVKLSGAGTDKSEWEVLEAPDGNHIQGGRYLEETMVVDPDKGTTAKFVTDKWTWLIDGQAGTLFHTTWTGAGVRPPTETAPDVFVIDTSSVQTFNYFAITTRNNSNSFITKYRLSISSDRNEWKVVSQYLYDGGKEDPQEGKLVYKNLVATLTFPQVSGRYWKLEVMATTGRNFTVIAELDTGIRSSTQRILPSSSNLLFTTSGWKKSAEIAGEPSGYLIAENKNEKAVIRFVGESFALYAATGEGYGTADVYVDGKKHASINLNSEITDARKLAVNVENLSNKEHTVEIVTTSTSKVMLNVIGIPYTAVLTNAPNIYLEHSLTVALVVFVLLFAALAALVCVLVFVPKFRAMAFGNRFMQKLDNRPKKEKKPKTDKKVEKGISETEEKPAVKAEEKVFEKPAPKAEAKPAAKPAPKVEAKPAAKPAPKAAEKPAAKPALKAEAKPAAKPAPAKKSDRK